MVGLWWEYNHRECTLLSDIHVDVATSFGCHPKRMGERADERIPTNMYD
jgi:hypothetical protein